ncbi:hypothetical protein BRC97_05920 [Halobacteriales archaeon QS_6_71_20]|nr:MAG: hypothetical protein BRC97_05920 [Halobacteriales archaeon QS_6_71_20]
MSGKVTGGASEEPPATGTGTDDPTETSTPGFGAVLAVVALLGAALPAARRQDN